VPRPPTPAQARAGLWALHALARAVRHLRRRPIEALRLPRPPRLGLDATRGVDVVLNRLHATCLQKSVVQQRWYAEHDVPYDVVIGVGSPKLGFKAHAWLEEPGQLTETEYTEIHRLPGQAAAKDAP
jgi:hypothetical protein